MASPPGGSIPALPPGLDLSSLLSVEFMRQSGAYALAAAFAGFTWDTLLCFPSEYKYFWKGKFTPGSFLYFMNRYFVVINLILGVLGVFVGPSPKVSVLWQTHLAGTGSFLQTTFAEAVLLRRALTILGNKSTFKYILYGGYFTSIIVAVTVTQFSVKSMTMATKSLFGTPMCAVITAERGAAYEVGFSFIPTTAVQHITCCCIFLGVHKRDK
ncbi:hypothetical protein DL96DRAFT_155191 [Flagelloscypha sp. PMI_526]|nr:hypothetical protein DL96DRAFT_155191 [Flagelloscypha sp. PMI_526]